MYKNDELMRGDYVMFTYTDKIVKIGKVDLVLRGSCLLLYDREPGKHDFRDEIIVDNDGIKPFIVNDAWLEKNGFVINSEYARYDYEINGLGRILYLMKGYDKETKETVEKYIIGADLVTNELHIIQHYMRLQPVVIDFKF